MKKPIYILILGACLGLPACNRQAESNHELLGKLDAISTQLSKGAAPVRWATANKSEITTAIYQWSRDKMEQAKKSEALPADTEARVSQYETLRMQLLQVRMPPRLLPIPYGAAPAEPSTADKEYEALSKKVAEAKAPVAAIIDRRERQAAEFRQQYSIERLVAEYVKDRYDLVIDSRDKALFQTAAETTDITDGVIALFKEKTRQ
jgi:hypothetical protein